MVLNKENLRELLIGTELWIAYQTRLPEKTRYLGIVDGYYCFGKPYNHNFYFLSEKNPEYAGNPNELVLHHISTTYEECCEIMRKLF